MKTLAYAVVLNKKLCNDLNAMLVVGRRGVVSRTLEDKNDFFEGRGNMLL
jgi:hypothetical protein